MFCRGGDRIRTCETGKPVVSNMAVNTTLTSWLYAA